MEKDPYKLGYNEGYEGTDIVLHPEWNLDDLAAYHAGWVDGQNRKNLEEDSADWSQK